MLAACPSHGDGVHNWLFKAARLLHAYHSPTEICNILAENSAGCGREVPDREIEDAVRNSSKITWVRGKKKGVKKGSRSPGVRRWPAVDKALRQSIIEKHPFTLAEYHDISPTVIDGKRPKAEWFVRQLFAGNSLLCVGRDKDNFNTNRLEALAAGLSDYSLIVPSVMSLKWGTTKEGKRSMHTLSNTGERMYLVVEFDQGFSDQHASILRHLSQLAPLVMVLWSGGKSTHGWFNCAGAPEQKVADFFRYAVSLGADPRMWSPCQFARLPQGWRSEKGVRQQVWYFDPEKTWKGPTQ
jgi:hypothetical protein